ncbi:hypothetical protein [Alicyclobacillus macrosporangiidus]|uniref:Uncharacterized protein n=1 Tax=Alicyclobacillus macrosporangiidus TaxID=392015 RepID=A0A1I7I8K1_9BACL|nr:hypothetical protein [Alicyclobacillus macrosporangiidus]SFU69289.1 hypothetical protein SAMN05421543_10669 [Alicyclobacillus macrosporangiidus]
MRRRRGRFVARPRRRSSPAAGALVGIGAVLCTAIVAWGLYGLFNKSPAGQEVSPAADAHTPPPRLTLQRTNWVWNNHPVYRLTNASSSTLSNVHVYSWSREKLPVLAIGRQPPAGASSAQPLQHPPFHLAPGDSVWVAGPAATDAKPFTVTWEDSGRVAYAILRETAEAAQRPPVR